MGSLLRRAALALGAMAVTVLLLAAAGFGVLQTGPGKTWIAATLSRLASGGDTHVEIDGLFGTVPFDFGVRKIRISDANGPWLTLEGARVDIAPGELVRGRLSIRNLSAEQVTLARLPDAGATERGAQAAPDLSVPELPLELELRTLRIDRLVLEAPVLGEPVAATLAGSATLFSRSAGAAVTLRRTDGQPGHGELAVDLGASGTLTVKANVAEPSGIVLQRILDREERVPLDIAISGSGPLDGWTGTLAATAGGLARLDADIALHGPAGRQIGANGRLTIASLLPADFAVLAPQPVTFAAAMTVGDDMITVDSLTADTGILRAKLGGHYERQTERLAAEGTLGVRDLAAFELLAGTPLEGTAEIAFNASGTLDAPGARLTVSGQNVRLQALRAGRIDAALAIAPDADRWRITGSGQLAEIAGGIAAIPSRIDWTLGAGADRKLDQVDIRRLEVQGGGLALSASGRIDGLTRAPKLTASARATVADLSMFSTAAQTELHGRAAITADIDADAGTVAVTLRSEATDLATGQRAVDALLGGRAEIAAAIKRASDGTVAVDDATLTAAHATLTANGTLASGNERVRGTVTLDVPRLAPVGRAFGTTLAGQSVLTAHISGPLNRPAVDAKLTAADLVADTVHLDRLNAEIALRDATAPAGSLDASFATGDLAGSASMQFARDVAGVLTIPKLTVQAPGTSLDAKLRVALDRTVLSGTVTGRASDLTHWSPLAGVPLSGQIEAKATFAGETGQSADVTLTATRLGLGADLHLDRARVTARMTDLFGTPAGRADIEVAGARAPSLSVERLRASGRSAKAGSFEITVDAAGMVSPGAEPAPFRLAAAGGVTVDRATYRARLARLSGRIGEHDLSLASPVVVVHGADTLRFDGLDLRVANGGITGSGAWTGKRIALKLTARALPLSAIEIAAPGQAIAGRLNGDVDVSGTLDRPQGRVSARVRDLRLTERTDLPPLGVSLDATWRGTRAEITGRIDGPDGSNIDVAGYVPLMLTANSVTPSVPREAPMHLTARGTGLLESWANALPLGEDRIAGRFDLNLSVDGTMAAPRAGGRVVVSNGEYLNFAAGTRLRELGLEVTGDGQRFVLRRLTAQDGAGGTLAAEGFLDLTASSGPAVRLTTNFGNFLVVRRDEATVTAGGDLRLAGTFAAMSLSGAIRVDRAEIRIPDRLPPSVTRLDVIEIDSRRGVVISEPETSPSAVTLNLDVAVEIPARAFVRGRGLDSEWEGKLQVGGTADDPELNGTLNVVRGDFALLGKRFALTKGAVRFDGGPEIEPRLDITTEHRSADIVAQAIVGGTLSAPTITLTSQPEMPQDEILARVLFGQSLSRMTPAQGLQIAQAAATLAGGGPGLLDRLRTATRLDRLDISGGDPQSGATGGANGGPTISGGKYVTDRVYVGVEQGASAQSTKTKVEVELTPNVTVESNVGIDSSAGVGVNWKWDY